MKGEQKMKTKQKTYPIKYGKIECDTFAELKELDKAMEEIFPRISGFGSLHPYVNKRGHRIQPIKRHP